MTPAEDPTAQAASPERRREAALAECAVSRLATLVSKANERHDSLSFRLPDTADAEPFTSASEVTITVGHERLVTFRVEGSRLVGQSMTCAAKRPRGAARSVTYRATR
ncbi:hypothetical protein GCM10023079_28830 [Streptomyces chitinivorans]